MDQITIAEEVSRLRDRRDARRRAAEDLKATRARLAAGTEMKPEFEYELLAMFIRNEIGAAFTMPALYALFAIASMFWAPVSDGVLWLVIVIIAKILLLDQGRRFLALPQNQVDVRLWRRRFIMIELLNGSTLAGFALIGVGQQVGAADSAVFSSHVFIFATLILVLAIRVMFAATFTQALLAGTIPMTLAVVVRLLLLADPFYLALASMAIGIYVYFLFLARGLKSTALSMLEFRSEKDALIAELEEQKSVSDEARRRAEAAIRAKSRFLATMSHELRTPLNAILGFSEVMNTEVMGPMTNPAYKEYAGNIFESGHHLLHLINEILDLSRIEAGKRELSERLSSLVAIAGESRGLLDLKARQREIAIAEVYDETMPRIVVDPQAIRQVVLNLLSNALKFTPPGGEIIIKVGRTQSGGQYISVRDNGPGIAKEEIPIVLSAFGQGSVSIKNAEQGTGLGIPIVQALIHLHGGNFTLRSQVGLGTEAIATLPAKRVVSAVTETDSGRQTTTPAQGGRKRRFLRSA